MEELVLVELYETEVISEEKSEQRIETGLEQVIELENEELTLLEESATVEESENTEYSSRTEVWLEEEIELIDILELQLPQTIETEFLEKSEILVLSELKQTTESTEMEELNITTIEELQVEELI